MTDPTIDQPSFEAMRHAMVASQLRTTAVSDARVIAAMARVPREEFVPGDGQRLAYRDTRVPLSATRAMNPAATTARLLSEARIGRDDRVLLIGAATGYAAAVVAVIAAAVTAVEEDAALAEMARVRLASYARAALVEGALAEGAPDAAPFDVLVVDGAVETLPDALAAQLRAGGRIVTGLLDRGVTRLAGGTRSGTGVGLFDFADLDCVVLPGFAKPRGFSF